MEVLTTGYFLKRPLECKDYSYTTSDLIASAKNMDIPIYIRRYEQTEEYGHVVDVEEVIFTRRKHAAKVATYCPIGNTDLRHNLLSGWKIVDTYISLKVDE